MKFIITVHDFRSVNGYSLAPRHVALGLKQKGHAVRFLCLHKPLDYYNGEDPSEFIEVKPQNIINNKRLLDFAPDVIITNGNSVVDVMALNYAKENGKFAISFVHSRYEKVIEQRYLPWGKYWPEPFISTIAEALLQQFKSADIIIALSPEMKQYLLHYFPVEKIRIVGNGIDLQQFPFKKRFPDEHGVINLLYVANLEKRKNQTFLLKMMQYLPDNYILHLVGGHDEELDYYVKFKAVLKKIQKIKPNNIVYYGKVSHKRINEIYDIAHVFVDSSLMEAQSVVLLEAIAGGLPIVRLNNADTCGVTVHNETAIHINEPTSPEEFAIKIQRLIANTKQYYKITRNQLKVREGFSRDVQTKKLVDLIEECVQARA